MSDRVLVIDDDPALREVLAAVLSDSGYGVRTAASGGEGRDALRSEGADLVLLDLRMPDIEGIDLIPELREIDAEVSIVMMTAYGSIKTAVESIRRGASDFLTKPFDLEEMKLTIGNALALQRLRRENAALRGIISERAADFPELTGLSPRMRELFRVMKRVAPFDVTVLVTGESGTGKELVARALHRNSPRRDGPLIAVNCAALPETLLETELFGHERGAFTGATSTRPGRFELARGGTLLLDEVGDMSPLMQAKLLRVLQEGEFQRVGGSSPIRSDVRIVAATNKDLAAEVAARRFREDLWYRLDVVSIRLPALRERRDDIPLLVARFLEEFGERYGSEARSVDEGALACLMRHDWPGNVRELKHCVEQAVILGDGPSITAAQLPESLRGLAQAPNADQAGGRLPQAVAGLVGAPGLPRGAEDPLDAVEARYILGILVQCEWNQSRAAEILGLHRNTLREKIRRYGLRSGQGGPEAACTQFVRSPSRALH
jgi:two-component system response regulator HydG